VVIYLTLGTKSNGRTFFLAPKGHFSLLPRPNCPNYQIRGLDPPKKCPLRRPRTPLRQPHSPPRIHPEKVPDDLPKPARFSGSGSESLPAWRIAAALMTKTTPSRQVRPMSRPGERPPGRISTQNFFSDGACCCCMIPESPWATAGPSSFVPMASSVPWPSSISVATARANRNKKAARVFGPDRPWFSRFNPQVASPRIVARSVVARYDPLRERLQQEASGCGVR